MSTIGAFLTAAAGPLAKRVLQALGIGIISYAGLAVAMNAVVDAVKSSWGGIVGPTLDIIQLAGFQHALGIVLGAMLAKLSFMVTERLGRIAS